MQNHKRGGVGDTRVKQFAFQQLTSDQGETARSSASHLVSQSPRYFIKTEQSYSEHWTRMGNFSALWCTD